MPDSDDRLAAQLREYYAQLARGPAPDVTGKVMAGAGPRATRLLSAMGGGLVAAAAAAVVVVALANHGAPTGIHPATSPTPQPTPTPSAVAPTSTPQPAPVIPEGPAVHGFIPSDVTALSAQQWWVIGYDGDSCSTASCTRILHTADGGQTFASLPTPPVAPGQSGQHDSMRVANSLDGWVYAPSGALWATHDGGRHWTSDGGAGRVTDLEASGGFVYAIACAQAASCTLERSPAAQDTWTALPIPAGSGTLGHLNVNGAHVWVVPGGEGGTSLLESADSGQHFTAAAVCSGYLGIVSVYAVNDTVVWATCATGTQARALLSPDGGRHFSAVGGPVSLANFASISGVSSTTAVIGAQSLLRTVDGGQTFAAVEDNQTQWSVVGFTTSSNGFAFDLQPSGQRALWRSNDAGAHWYLVRFP